MTDQKLSQLTELGATPANDDEVFAISPSGLLGIMLDVAPSTSMDFHYGCTIREIGG